MKRKTFHPLILAIMLLGGLHFALNIHADEPKVSESDLALFDADGDGKLSEAERDLMFQATTFEVFTGRDLNAEDLRQMRRERGFGGRGGFRARMGPRRAEMIVDRFDGDNDGKLNGEERKAAQSYIRNSRGESGSARPSGRSSPNTTLETDLQMSRANAPKGEPHLYDAKTLRTVYLRFHDEDWYEQLGDFYRTDVNLPADLIVDGKVYPSVGVRFRGSSSYFTIRDSEKKSFHIAVDYGDDGKRLYGYKTLNLLNGHADPSFLREVLYARIAQNYIPASKANFVKLMINGESWGIYINAQQFNKDFLNEWFGTRRGVRWKVPPSREGGLVYNGENPDSYRRAYQLKTNDAPNAWVDLIALCKILDETPDEKLEGELSRVFNIDRALWNLALENVFIDNDGYFSRASDYAIYQDPLGRFHLLPQDNNETFRYAGGGGPNSWDYDGPMLSPVAQESDAMRPVISRLFSIPHLRARYLAHIRTIVGEWLDWEVLAPIIEEYRSLIDAEVKADHKKLYAYEAFAASHIGNQSSGSGSRAAPSFKQFVDERRQFLLNHPEINRPTASIQFVSQPKKPLATEPVLITAEIGADTEIDAVMLYYATSRLAPFASVRMSRHGGGYTGEIPAVQSGAEVRYYVEARTLEADGTTVFSPTNAEMGALSYRVRAPLAESTLIVINELMPNNTESVADPQGEHDDWIELHNLSSHEVDLSNMYLSDNPNNPRKWAFPDNTVLAPHGYIIVWADEDSTDRPGLHANFKLSRRGEIVMLIDTDARRNQILSSVEYGAQEKDVALGRFPNGIGDFKPLAMTPGKPNN
ncbi:MAG: CotH kinase family protein [Candidatus Poribacteria bacterium]|nr:CotH kinase family protein [Candidatus Poribacteria bacterium]